MTKPQIISENAMNLAQVKDELVRIKKRDDELNFRANKTEEYLNLVTKLSAKKAAEIYTALEALAIPRLKDAYMHKIIDVCPQSVKELKVVLQGYTITVTSENMQKIVDVIKQHS